MSVYKTIGPLVYYEVIISFGACQLNNCVVVTASLIMFIECFQ